MIWACQKKTDDTIDPLLRVVVIAIEQTIGRSAGAIHATISADAFLGADLGLSSIGVARLAATLQKRCGRKPLPFHMLFVKPDGSVLQDIRVSDIVCFLEKQLSADT